MMRQITRRGISAWKLLLWLLVVVNVITGIFVIVSVVCRSKSRDTHKLTPQTFKEQLDKIYEVHKESPVSTEPHDTPEPSSTLDFLSLLKPVVHLPGTDGQMNTSRPSIVRNWVRMKGSPRFLLYNGPEYENGTITIPANGIYVVYSHVKFYVKSYDKELGLKQFTHEVVKSKVDSLVGETVLANHLTECREEIQEDSHLDFPSDVRGVLELKKGEQVKVKLSHPHLLTDSTDWNFFGLYMI